MNRQEKFATGLTVLSSALGRDLNGAAIEGYWAVLKDLTDGELATATRRALREFRFMPSPAELLALSGNRERMDTAIAQAWEAVRGAVDRHDYTTSVDFGPLVNAVIRNLGGWQRLCSLPLEDLNVWARKEFERIYPLFAEKDARALNGEPHRGAFGGAPVPVAIAGKLPPRQLESEDRAPPVLRALAGEKAAR